MQGQNWGNPDRLGVLGTVERDRVGLAWVGLNEEAGPGGVLGCGGTSSPLSSWVIDKDGPGQSVSTLLLAPRPEDAVQAQKVPESVASRSLKGPLSPLVNLKVTQIPGFLRGCVGPEYCCLVPQIPGGTQDILLLNPLSCGLRGSDVGFVLSSPHSCFKRGAVRRGTQDTPTPGPPPWPARRLQARPREEQRGSGLLHGGEQGRPHGTGLGQTRLLHGP